MKKIFLFFVSISIFFLFSFADEWQEFYDSVRVYYLDGDYSKAEIKAKELLDYTLENFSPTSVELAHTQNIYGLILKSLSKFDDAKNYFLKSLEIFKSNKENKNYGIVEVNLGGLYFDQYLDSIALIWLLDGVDILKGYDDYENLVNPYYQLYQIYYGYYDYDNARKFLLRLIDVEEKFYGKDDTLIGIDYRSLAWLYMETENYDSAGIYFDKSIDVLKINGGFKNIQLGISYNDYGVKYDYEKNYEKAIENYLKAVDIFEKASEKKEVANTYNNIGLAYEKLSDRKNAAEYYLKAYEIAKIIYDENDDVLKKYKKNYDRVK